MYTVENFTTCPYLITNLMLQSFVEVNSFWYFRSLALLFNLLLGRLLKVGRLHGVELRKERAAQRNAKEEAETTQRWRGVVAIITDCLWSRNVAMVYM